MKHTPYSNVPQPQNRIASVASAVTFAVALIGLYGSQLMPAFPALLQLIGLFALVASIYMLVRAQTRYIYAVEPDGTEADEDDLVIARRQGKRRTVVCRLAMKDIREIDMATPENKKELAQKYHGDNVHNYCAELMPARSVYLRFADSAPGTMLSATEDEITPASVCVVIRISPDEHLLSMLRAELGE